MPWSGARTPSASSPASSATPCQPGLRSRGASSSRLTKAEPTMTPSANPATSAACSGLTPQPDAHRQRSSRGYARPGPRLLAHRLPRSGDAHQGGRVDEAAARRRDLGQPLVPAARRDDEDGGQTVLLGGLPPRLRTPPPAGRGGCSLLPRPRPARRRSAQRRSGRRGSSTSCTAPAHPSAACASRTVRITSAMRTPPRRAMSSAVWMTGPSRTGSLCGSPISTMSQPPSSIGGERRHTPPSTEGKPAGR